jgi:peroxiredoxin
MQASFQPAVIVLLVFILISSIGLWFVLYQVVKQQGRILLRLDEIGHHTNGDAVPEPQGLTVGTQFDSFALPDLTGQIVTLEQFRGKRVLLVNWSPQCGFCDLIAPDLAQLQTDFQKRNVELVLVSSADAEANRKLAEEHGLKCSILLMKESESLEAFQNMGTPSAYLLDEEGRVAKPLSVGANDVPDLAREAVNRRPKKKRLSGERPLSESRIEREGIKAGTPAPTFSLPDIHGRTISLEEYRGRRVLLVFTDPHCGPCDQLTPELVRLHREHRYNGMEFVMVGRGEADENRRKAEEHGIEFPVVLQERWKLSKQYGIFSTPVGFLINEEGIIEKNVGKGGDEILLLAHEGLSLGKAA